MIRKTILTAAVLALAAGTATAQEPRVELSATAGWTFSDGVNVGSIDESPIQVGPKDAFSWGARLGFNLSPNSEIGFLFASQSTDLEATGVVTRTIPQTVYNYHGYFAYNFGDPDAAVRPYILGGLGATQYGSLDTAAGVDRRRDAVLDHLGAGPQDDAEPEVRHPSRDALDAHLHQDRPRGLLVRPLLGLLHGRGRGVLEPVRALRRDHHPVLGRTRRCRPRTAPPHSESQSEETRDEVAEDDGGGGRRPGRGRRGVGPGREGRLRPRLRTSSRSRRSASSSARAGATSSPRSA